MKRTLLTLALVAAAGTAGAQTMQTQGSGTMRPRDPDEHRDPMNSGTPDELRDPDRIPAPR